MLRKQTIRLLSLAWRLVFALAALPAAALADEADTSFCSPTDGRNGEIVSPDRDRRPGENDDLLRSRPEQGLRNATELKCSLAFSDT
jgi:hypothetical protein